VIDDLPNLESGPTEDQLAFARAYLAERPMEPAILARIQSPDDIAARDAAKAERLARDWAGLGYYRRANAALTGRPVEVVFIGDSITEMWAVAEPDLFCGRPRQSRHQRPDQPADPAALHGRRRGPEAQDRASDVRHQ
jgi:hypothetical protein